MRVIFSKLAKQELDDATHYYEIELQGFGKLFRGEVRRAVKRITVYPEAWSVERGDVRKCFCLLATTGLGVTLIIRP